MRSDVRELPPTHHRHRQARRQARAVGVSLGSGWEEALTGGGEEEPTAKRAGGVMHAADADENFLIWKVLFISITKKFPNMATPNYINCNSVR